MNFQSVLKKSVSFFADSATTQTPRQNNAQMSSSSTKKSDSNSMNTIKNPQNNIHGNSNASASSSSSGHHLNASQMLNKSTIAQRASLKIRQRPLSTYNPQPKSGTVNATRILHTRPFY